MPREKQGYRDTIALLNERFPEHDVLNKTQVAQFLGVSTRTVSRYAAAGKIRFNKASGRITKSELARQVCS